MKKLFILALTLVMLVLTVAVGAEEAKLAIEPMLNYSSDAVVSVDCNSSEVLNELAFGDASLAPDPIDPETLFKSLFSFDGTATIKADISEDYNKIKLYMQADYDYDVDVNPNLGIVLDMKMGAWLDMDMSDLNNAKCNVILYTPVSAKYMYCNLFDFLPADQSRLLVFAMIKSVLNKEFVTEMNEAMLTSYENHAEITFDGDICTIKLSNDAYLKMIDELVPVFIEKLAAIMSVPEEQLNELAIPSFAETGIQLLGENGIVVKYNTKDFSSEVNADICINIGEIIAMMMEEDFYGMDDMTVGFTMTGTEKYYDIGSTVVTFPELTEENSINLYDEYYHVEDDYYEENYYEEYEETYPYYYVNSISEYSPVVDGDIYVPFRVILEDAYDGNVEIGYDKGLITVTSEYFTDMEKISFKVGESKVNVDGYDFEVGEILLENGVTYVPADFYEIVFGWELSSAYYDYIEKYYYASFVTDTEW